jgi:putative membrane protein
VGFFIEVAGVYTGVIFGQYTYGLVLGVKLWGTPLMIGVNWFMTTYVFNDLVSRIKINRLFKIILAATVITAMDWVIEPDATRLGMWNWSEGDIPLQNYIAWWIVSFVLSYYYHRWEIKQNPLAPVVALCMIIFFLSN